MVDWRSSIAEEARQLGRARRLEADWEGFADAWRGKYRPSMNLVRAGQLPWMNLDGLHRCSLDALLGELGLDGFNEDDRALLTSAWHRLRPWPDARAGLARLRTRYVLATLSNGNMALLVDLVKHAELPFDAILSAELVRAYKPDPAVYRMAADLLGLETPRLLMVAAHPDDLEAAAGVGLRTAFVRRPLEWGPGRAGDVPSAAAFDLAADDFVHLADQLGC